MMIITSPPLSFGSPSQVWTIVEMKVFLFKIRKKNFVTIFHPIPYLTQFMEGKAKISDEHN
jgi:hypothetical protein